MSTGTDLLDTFIVAIDYPTGGNCRAWRLEMPNGRHVLVTTTEGAYQPDRRTKRVSIGLYDEAGDEVEAVESSTWAQAIVTVRRWVVQNKRAAG